MIEQKILTKEQSAAILKYANERDNLNLVQLGFFVRLLFWGDVESLDESLGTVYRETVISSNHLTDEAFEDLLEVLITKAYIRKDPIVLPGKGISHSHHFMEQIPE
jgi:hypothetical protein